MGEEVELETLAQNRVINLADPALPGRACIGNQNIQATEPFSNRRKGALYRFVIGHIAGQCQPAQFRCQIGDLSCIQIEQRHIRARGPEPPAPSPDRSRRPAPVIATHLPGERGFPCIAQLGLFQRPVFDIEHVAIGDGAEPPDSFSRRDDINIVFIEIGRQIG